MAAPPAPLDLISCPVCDTIDREDGGFINQARSLSYCRCRGNGDDVTVIISRRRQAGGSIDRGSNHKLQLSGTTAGHRQAPRHGASGLAGSEFVVQRRAELWNRGFCSLNLKPYRAAGGTPRGKKRLMHPDGSEAPWLFKNQVGCHVSGMAGVLTHCGVV